MRDELLKLAERVEALTGLDREVDSAIDRLTYFGPGRNCWCTGACERGNSAYQGACVAIPHFTASLDAAMGLVPSGWHWSLSDDGLANLVKRGRAYPVKCGKAATPALALTAAALRARAEGVA